MVLRYQSGKWPSLQASAKLARLNGPAGNSDAMSDAPARARAQAGHRHPGERHRPEQRRGDEQQEDGQAALSFHNAMPRSSVRSETSDSANRNATLTTVAAEASPMS